MQPECNSCAFPYITDHHTDHQYRTLRNKGRKKSVKEIENSMKRGGRRKQKVRTIEVIRAYKATLSFFFFNLLLKSTAYLLRENNIRIKKKKAHSANKLENEKKKKRVLVMTSGCAQTDFRFFFNARSTCSWPYQNPHLRMPRRNAATMLLSSATSIFLS